MRGARQGAGGGCSSARPRLMPLPWQWLTAGWLAWWQRSTDGAASACCGRSPLRELTPPLRLLAGDFGFDPREWWRGREET